MSSPPPRQIVPRDEGFFRNIWLRVRLVLRLMADRRVPFLLKLIPVGSLVYFIFPDLAPTPIDDAVVIGLGGYLFVELCPPHVVKEHMDALTSVVEGEWKEVPEGGTPPEETKEPPAAA
jgi:hypothetical protein